jgi:hypothetical protein
MKYILILYICTLSPQPYCEQDQIVNRKFSNYYDCITVGYLNSYRHLTEMYDRDEVIKNKLAIKFQCKKIGTPT